VDDARALLAYSLGLVGLIMVKVLAPVSMRGRNIRTPVKIALFTLFATQLMNLAFIWQLRLPGWRFPSLGRASTPACCSTTWRKHDIYHPQPGWLKFFSCR